MPLHRFFLFFLAPLLFVSCRQGSDNKRNASGADTLSYEVVTLAREYRQCHPDSDNCTRICMRFPKFRNISGYLADSLAGLQSRCFQNAETGVSDPQLVMEFFIRRYEEVVKVQGAGAPSWQMEHRLSVVHQTPEWICLEMLESGYSGGTHENRFIRYYTLEKATGRQLALADFFDSTGLEKLTRTGEASFCKARDLKPGQNLEEGGFTFAGNRFALPENFYFDAAGLTFCFNEYEIGPYSMGETVFTIPTRELPSMRKNDR